jgi:phosphatidylinositol alpha-mannosyltransferase
MKKLKIGFVLDDRLDKPDGVQAYVTTVGGWMSKQGHEVHYLVGNSPGYSGDTRVHHLSKTKSVRFNKNRMSIPLPANKKAIKQLLGQIDFDVLHVQMPYSPYLAGRVIKSMKQKTVLVGTFHILPYSLKEKLGTRALSRLVGSTKKRFDRVFSVSSAAQTFARSHFGIKSIVIPNAVNLTNYKTPKPVQEERARIVYLGRLVERKGPAYLIAAYAKILDNDRSMAKKTELIIGGKGPDLQKLKKQAESITKAHKDAQIHFLGFVSDAEKPSLLASARLAAFPSTGGESFGIVLVEAMAAGAGVVIGGNNDGYKTVLGDELPVVFNPKDTTQFAECLKTLLSDHELLKKLHNKQQKDVLQYDVSVIGKELIEQYSQLVQKRSLRHNKAR